MRCASALALLGALILAAPAAAQDAVWRAACFQGVNNTDSPAVIGDCEAQDAQDVEANLGGTALLKRKGFAQEAALTVSTSAVTGRHRYKDSSGNFVTVACHDRYCAKSVNGGAFSNFLSTAGGTGAVPTRWSFTDLNGLLYGGNDKQDPILKYDGTTLTYPLGMPKGSILAMTQDRMVVGDISGSPNRVYFSSSGSVENFTTGGNNEDPFYDDLGAPGDKVTGLVYNRGFLFVFKSDSITACELGNQYTTKCVIISPNIGTNDPASIIVAGNAKFFRGNDGAFWRLDDYGLQQVSRKIRTTIAAQTSGSTRSNTQTTQGDWNAGQQFPSSTWDTTTVSGSIFPSSSTFVDASTSAFALGIGTGNSTGAGVSTNGYVSFAGVTSTYVYRYEGSILPDSDGWTASVTPVTAASVAGGSLTVRCDAGNSGSYYRTFTIGDNTTTHIVFRAARSADDNTGSIGIRIGRSISGESMTTVGVVTISSGSYLTFPPSAVTIETLAQPAYSTYTIIVDTASGGTGGKVSFWRNGIFKSSAAFLSASAVPNQIRIECFGGSVGSTYGFFDFVYIASATPNPGVADIPAISTFNSRVFDTTVDTPTLGNFASTQTVPTNTAVTWQLRSSTSPNNDMWGSYSTIVPPVRPTAYTNRYIQYKTTLQHSAFVESPGITGVSLQYATTGFYRTQCIQPASSLSGWGSLSCAQTLAGNGSEVFYATSAATCGTLPSTPPGSWQTSITNNATLSIATNTAVYIGWRSLLGSATDQAQIDACVLNWTEGTPAQPVWATYDSIKNAVYWTATIGTSTYSNRLLKYDLNLDGWFIFSLTPQAPLVYNGTLYFGSSSSGTWNRYGGNDSDNGAPINAYWITRDIGATAPFQEKDFKRVSLLARNQGSGSLTTTWTLSNAKTGNYSVTLSTTSGLNYVRSNFYLPAASPQNFMNLRLGNNAANQPFEIMGIQVDFTAAPWRVGGP